MTLFTSQSAAAFYDKLFSSLDFTLPRAATGRRGFPKEAMVCAFIVMKCEGFAQITDLMDYLDNNRLIAHYCGFNIMEPLPSYWTYDRFLRQLDNTGLKSVMADLVRQLYELGIVDTSFIGLDSTPVMANTKQNNPKSFAKNKFSKENHPKSDPDCALGVHSASNQHNERRYEFYWGYKSHVLVDCISGLPLYELTTPGNIADSAVAAEILAAADQTISLKECAFLADKGYDAKSIYNTVKSVYEGEAFIPSIHAVRKPLKRFLPVIQSARPGWLCTRTAKPPTMGVPGRNTAARSASPRPVFALVTTKTGTTARKTEAARNIKPFPMTTDFPLTVAASVSREHTPCVQSASVTILASNPQVRNGCGCAMEPARQTSIRWLISLP
ncbi:MAG: transposase [Oscillospiraceae bacterium]